MAVARSRSGNQVVTTRLLIGYAGASRAPTAMRNTNRAMKLAAKPSITVATDHSSRATLYRMRGGTRSTSQPPGICMAA